MRRASALVGLLLLGAAVGLAAVWTHGRWWALALGAAASLAAAWAAAAGLPRLAYVGGWVATSAYFLLARPEGDFIVATDARGYAFLGLALVLIVLGVATLPARRRIPVRAGDTP